MKEFLKKDLIFACFIASFAGFSHQVFNIVFPVYILDIGGTNAMTGLISGDRSSDREIPLKTKKGWFHRCKKIS